VSRPQGHEGKQGRNRKAAVLLVGICVSTAATLSLTFMTCRMRGAFSLLCSKLGRLLPSAGCSTKAALSSLT